MKEIIEKLQAIITESEMRETTSDGYGHAIFFTYAEARAIIAALRQTEGEAVEKEKPKSTCNHKDNSITPHGFVCEKCGELVG